MEKYYYTRRVIGTWYYAPNVEARLEIIKVMELKKKEIPQLYCSPLVPPETEEQAIAWASRLGAKKLYVFERTIGPLYFVEVR